MFGGLGISVGDGNDAVFSRQYQTGHHICCPSMRTFSHNPRRTHEIALNHIARYFQGNKDKGLILSPDRNKLQLDLYADADFAGLFVSEDKQDPVSIKSQTGLLINFGGAPIF